MTFIVPQRAFFYFLLLLVFLNRSSLSSRIYVTENGTLKGYITMAVLLTHQPDTPVADLLREMEEMLREVCRVHAAVAQWRHDARCYCIIIGTPLSTSNSAPPSLNYNSLLVF